VTRHVNNKHADETPLNDPAWLRKQYENHTIREIADKLNASEFLVNRRLHEFGIEVRRIPPEASAKLSDGAYLRREYAEEPKRSAPDIARELDVSSATVYTALDQHGIEERHKKHSL
jgi:transposase